MGTGETMRQPQAPALPGAIQESLESWRMKTRGQQSGAVLIMVVFVVALLSAIITGMLQINTEEIQVMRNHIHAAEALAVAEAGLNDALAQLRDDSSWNAGFENKPFVDGQYTVTVDDGRIISVATSSRGYMAKMEATVTVTGDIAPYVVRIDNLKVNE